MAPARAWLGLGFGLGLGLGLGVRVRVGDRVGGVLLAHGAAEACCWRMVLPAHLASEAHEAGDDALHRAVLVLLHGLGQPLAQLVEEP